MRLATGNWFYNGKHFCDVIHPKHTCPRLTFLNVFLVTRPGTLSNPPRAGCVRGRNVFKETGENVPEYRICKGVKRETCQAF